MTFPSDVFYRYCVHRTPEDARPEVVLAFALATANGATSATDAFLSLCREYIAAYLREHAHRPEIVPLIEELGHGGETPPNDGAPA